MCVFALWHRYRSRFMGGGGSYCGRILINFPLNRTLFKNETRQNVECVL